MLAIDWKCWRSYLKSSSAYSMTIQMLGRVAGSLLFFDNFCIIRHYCYILTSLHYFISLDMNMLIQKINYCYMLTSLNYFISLDMNILNQKINVLVYILHFYLLISLACTALRELFRTRQGNCTLSDYSSGELTRNSRNRQKEEYASSDTQILADENSHDNSIGEVDPTQSEHASLVSLNDADDEFYDVMEPSNCDESENEWLTECSYQKSQVKV